MRHRSLLLMLTLGMTAIVMLTGCGGLETEFAVFIRTVAGGNSEVGTKDLDREANQ